MYLNTYGGSALLHLLIGYPRLVLIFGLAGLVGMTSTPLGPGRYSGTGAYLAQLDSVFKPRLAEAAAEQRARQAATDMLLRRVLVLYQLDLAATRAGADAARSDAEAIHTTAQR